MDTNINETSPSITASLSIWLIGLLAMAFSALLRIEPTVMQTHVFTSLQLSSATLGALHIDYEYYIIAALLAAGVLTDFMGAKTVLFLALITAIIANYLFSHSPETTLYARIVISHVHSFILISVLALGATWLSGKHFAFFVGLIFAALLIFPTLLKTLLPVVSSLDNLTSMILDINLLGGFVIFCLILSLFTPPLDLPLQDAMVEIANTFYNIKIWLLCFVSLVGWLLNTFILNYANTYLITVAHFEASIAANTVNIAFYCFVFGMIIMGLCADKYREKCTIISCGYFISALCFSILIYAPSLNALACACLLFLASFFCGITTASYAKALDFISFASVGLAFGLIASITALGNNLATKELDHLLELYVKTPSTDTLDNWQMILSLIPLLLLIGTILAWASRRKSLIEKE